MSIFRNIRIFPAHGQRSAAITWQLAPDAPVGDVFVAFSTTGTAESWTVRNPDAPVGALVGLYQDDALEMNSGWVNGYYKLLLVDGATDYFSEPVMICGDLTPREYGMIRGILHREFLEMRVANGYPVWHCIPKDIGTPSLNTDPDTGETPGVECPGIDPADASYDMPFVGGFFPPILTWMRPNSVARGTIKDSESGLSVSETDTIAARLLSWPTPSRGHMIVDPSTDRRYLIGDEIKPALLRGIFPVTYDVTLEFLGQGDSRYRFPVPDIDTRAYRKI